MLPSHRLTKGAPERRPIIAKSPSIPRDQRNRREAGRDRDLSIRKKGAVQAPPKGDPDVNFDEKAAVSDPRRNFGHPQQDR